MQTHNLVIRIILLRRGHPGRCIHIEDYKPRKPQQFLFKKKKIKDKPTLLAEMTKNQEVANCDDSFLTFFTITLILI